jgi:hypothetical protein
MPDVRGAFPNIDRRMMTAGRYEGATAEKAVPFPTLSVDPISLPAYKGAKMIIDIDLDSWEVGYVDGQFDRRSQCPTNLDLFSYAAGYCEGRASHAEPTGINLPEGASRASIVRQYDGLRLLEGDYRVAGKLSMFVKVLSLQEPMTQQIAITPRLLHNQRTFRIPFGLSFQLP